MLRTLLAILLIIFLGITWRRIRDDPVLPEDSKKLLIGVLVLATLFLIIL